MRLRSIVRFLLIPEYHVAIDAGTWTDSVQKVYKNAGSRGYYGMQGEAKDRGYPWPYEEEDENGDIIEGTDWLPYSKPQDRDAGIGTKDQGRLVCTVFQWSNKWIKDHLKELRDGNGAYWGLPSNLEVLDRNWMPGEKVMKQFDSETVKDKYNKDTGKVEKFWGKRSHSSQNHLWGLCLYVFSIHAYTGAFLMELYIKIFESSVVLYILDTSKVKMPSTKYCNSIFYKAKTI